MSSASAVRTRVGRPAGLAGLAAAVAPPVVTAVVPAFVPVLVPLAAATVSSPAAFVAADSAVAFAASARWANCPAALWAVGACVVVVVVLPSGSAVTGFGFRTVIHAAMKATAQIRTIRMGGEIWDIAHPPSAFRSVV